MLWRYFDNTKTQNSTLLLLPVPYNSASQFYLSSFDAQRLFSLFSFLNECTEGAVTTANGRLLILMLNEYFRSL